MLNKVERQPAAATDATVIAYLRHTLGAVPSIRAWPRVSELPYFLLDAFEIRQLTLKERPLLLAIDKSPERRGLADVRAQIEHLKQRAGISVIYVTGALASYERKRLIEQQVPFLVPGNQLYLPDLGIDLREHFRATTFTEQTALSPATQAMLIAALLRTPWRGEWRAAAAAEELGYTAMTLSRAVRELTAAGIVTVRTEGRTRWLRATGAAAQTWERATPLLRSPVKRRIWVSQTDNKKLAPLRRAGLSALASYSMIADPPRPTYALSPTDWKVAIHNGVETLRAPVLGTCEWEIWHYSPKLVSDSETVDPLSLALSLNGHTDERVQLALDELKGRYPW